MIWTIVIYLITISLLVTFHEFGHFIIARLCDVKVECFSIGFGKKLWTYTGKKGTEFAISAIPLGGYVKMLESHNVDAEQDKTKAFDQKSIGKRAAIMLAGPIANFILAIIIYWIIFQIGVITYPVIIAKTHLNTPAASINMPQNVELKSIAGIQVETWKDVNTAILSELGKTNIDIAYRDHDQILYSRSINISNWKFDVEKESPITALGFVPASIKFYPTIKKIVPKSAADIAGFKAGDEIIRYNNKAYDNWDNLTDTIKNANPIEFLIKRGTDILSIQLTPKLEHNERGRLVGVAGIYPNTNVIIKQYGILDAFTNGITQTGLMIKVVLSSFYQLITGIISINNISGPITIAKVAGQTASDGLVSYLYFLAFISVTLGVMNLIPLPMLDGGHILFLLIEKLKGSPLSTVKLELFYRIGFVLLMAIMGIALFNDFVRLSL